MAWEGKPVLELGRGVGEPEIVRGAVRLEDGLREGDLAAPADPEAGGAQQRA
jgi:hypothetical protein